MTNARSRDDVTKQDVADLHRLGYAQELFRSMGGFSNFAISFSIISILTGAVILYDYGLAWAGKAAVTLGWPPIGIGVGFAPKACIMAIQRSDCWTRIFMPLRSAGLVTGLSE